MQIEYLKRRNQKTIKRTIVEAADAPAIDLVLSQKSSGLKAHGNSQAVTILEVVDEVKYYSNPKAKPLSESRFFDSATEASLHLGCGPQEVSQALYRARKLGRCEAELRGLLLAKVDDVAGLD